VVIFGLGMRYYFRVRVGLGFGLNYLVLLYSEYLYIFCVEPFFIWLGFPFFLGSCSLSSIKLFIVIVH